VADVRTTSVPATRIVERRRPAFAVARPRTTARICVTLEAIAPWTRIAAQVDIALPRWRPATQLIPKPWSRAGTMAVRTLTIAIRHRTSAPTIRTALCWTQGQPPRPPWHTRPALTTCRTNAGSAPISFAAFRDPVLPHSSDATVFSSACARMRSPRAASKWRRAMAMSCSSLEPTASFTQNIAARWHTYEMSAPVSPWATLASSAARRSGGLVGQHGRCQERPCHSLHSIPTTWATDTPAVNGTVGSHPASDVRSHAD